MTTKSKLTGALAAVVLVLSGVSTALADQVTIAWIDAGSQAQTLTIDTNSSAADLALAASLLGEFGVEVNHDPANGAGTLAEIAAAMAGVAPLFAPDIAQVLAWLSPQDKNAIVAAVNAVAGVDSGAVFAAVHFPLPNGIHQPPVAADFGLTRALSVIEQVPSRN